MRADRLLQIAADVRRAPAEQFDLSTSWDCGTTACAIGWHLRFHPTCGLTISKGVWALSFGQLRGWPAVQVYLCISGEDAWKLFDSRAYRDGDGRESVASRIEQYVRDHQPKQPTAVESPVIEMKPERPALAEVPR